MVVAVPPPALESSCEIEDTGSGAPPPSGSDANAPLGAQCGLGLQAPAEAFGMPTARTIVVYAGAGLAIPAAGFKVKRCFAISSAPATTIRPCAATIAIQKRIGSCATI